MDIKNNKRNGFVMLEIIMGISIVMVVLASLMFYETQEFQKDTAKAYGLKIAQYTTAVRAALVVDGANVLSGGSLLVNINRLKTSNGSCPGGLASQPFLACTFSSKLFFGVDLSVVGTAIASNGASPTPTYSGVTVFPGASDSSGNAKPYLTGLAAQAAEKYDGYDKASNFSGGTVAYTFYQNAGTYIHPATGAAVPVAANSIVAIAIADAGADLFLRINGTNNMVGTLNMNANDIAGARNYTGVGNIANTGNITNTGALTNNGNLAVSGSSLLNNTTMTSLTDTGNATVNGNASIGGVATVSDHVATQYMSDINNPGYSVDPSGTSRQNVVVSDNQTTYGNINLSNGSSIISPGRLHIEAGENLYLKPWAAGGSVYVGGGGGNGNLSAVGAIDAGGTITAAWQVETWGCSPSGAMGRAAYTIAEGWAYSGTALSCVNGVWTSMKGATGAQGSQGFTGATGAQGPQGPQGTSGGGVNSGQSGTWCGAYTYCNRWSGFAMCLSTQFSGGALQSNVQWLGSTYGIVGWINASVTIYCDQGVFFYN